MKIEHLLTVAIMLTINESAIANRSHQTKRLFKIEQPCPITNKSTGRCRGYVMDHKIPLCAGGPDAPENLQWSKKRESYKKDTEERFICRKIKANLIRPYKNKSTFCNQIKKYKLPLTKQSVCK